MVDELVGKLERWGQDLVLLLPNLGVALAVVLAAWLLSIVVGKTVANLVGRISDHRTLNELIRKLARFAVMVAGLLIALSILRLDEAAATFLAGAGIVGIALGFAFQDLSANFISGVAMAIKQPIRVGDLIETSDLVAIVERIELRSTELETLDGKKVIIPNRKIFENAVINHSRSGCRRVEIKVGVSYGDDLELVRRVTIGAVEGVTPRLPRPVELFFEEFGESSIDLVVRFWIAFRSQTDYLTARSAAIVAVRQALAGAGITIPFPIRTLDFGVVGGQPLREHLGGR